MATMIDSVLSGAFSHPQGQSQYAQNSVLIQGLSVNVSLLLAACHTCSWRRFCPYLRRRLGRGGLRGWYDGPLTGRSALTGGGRLATVEST